MNINKDSVKGFRWTEFKEHPEGDFQDQERDLFDVPIRGVPGFFSNAMEGFSQKQYCVSLMEIILDLSTYSFPAFLDYQCKQMKDPIQWLSSLYFLFDRNKEHDLLNNFKDQIILLIEAIRVKRVQLTRKPDSKMGKFDFKSVKEASKTIGSYEEKVFFLKRRRLDYLQEVAPNEEHRFVRCIDIELEYLREVEGPRSGGKKKKRFVFMDSTKELSKLFSELMFLKNDRGERMFDGTTNAFTKLICTCFCKENGDSFSEDSVRKYLSIENAKRE